MIEPYVTPRTKAIIITTPNNPAGYTIPEAELRQLGQYVTDKPWWIIADEIYEYMSYDFPAVSMATLCPGCTRQVFSTAPTPVWTAQPNSASSAKGTSSASTRTTE